MADITKCKGTGCRLKETCYRYNVKSDSLYQSYFAKPPMKDGKCDSYWEHKIKSNGKQTNHIK